MVPQNIIVLCLLTVSLFIISSVLSYQPTVATNYVCPPKFNVVGRYCYHFSKDQTTWQEAHFRCLSLNSTFAIVKTAHQEFLIRKFLDRNSAVLGRYERWIGGRFNWKKSRWEWGSDGKPLKFQGFSRMNTQSKDMWKWHCIIIDPARYNKWGARNCLNTKRYVCQTPVNKNVLLPDRKKPIFNEKMCNDTTRITLEQRRFCNKKKNDIPDSIPGFLVHQPKKTNQTPVYNNYICPSHMILLGRKCYYFSTEALSWDKANWACRDNHTKLAMIHNKLQDNILRGFLNRKFIEKRKRWTGATYDWHQNKWKWAINGRVLKYKNFAHPLDNNGGDLQFTCISLDPQYKHKWTPESCLDAKHYVCQAKPKTVIKYDRGQSRKLTPKATVVIAADNGLDNRIGPIKTTQPTYLSKN